MFCHWIWIIYESLEFYADRKYGTYGEQKMEEVYVYQMLQNAEMQYYPSNSPLLFILY